MDTPTSDLTSPSIDLDQVASLTSQHDILHTNMNINEQQQPPILSKKINPETMETDTHEQQIISTPHPLCPLQQPLF